MRISDWSSDVCSSDLELLATTGHEASDIDWVVPHQANRRILEATARKMGIDMSRMIVTIDDHANTSAASVPLALDHGLRAGRLKKGDLVVLEAFGGGVTWGGAMLRRSEEHTSELQSLMRISYAVFCLKKKKI